LTVDWQWNLTVLAQKFTAAEIHYHPEARHHLVNEAEPIREALFSAINTFIDQMPGGPHEPVEP
ncbi:MAG: alpha/beta hydrolase, partial [Halomonas sp.]